MAKKINQHEIKIEFERKLPAYQEAIEKLYVDIANTLQEEKIHSIKYRIKTFESFFSKIILKQYGQPFKQCTDIAGCRVICLFKDQIPRIASLIEKKYEIVEKVISEKSPEEFAYHKYHILVKINEQICEIQLRTIVQEAWAEIEHYINYSQTLGTDPTLLRKINALSALFEIAEDQFRDIHVKYQEMLQQPATVKELTPIALYHYCKKTFAWAWKESTLFEDLENIARYSVLVERCKTKKIKSISELDALYQEKKKSIELEENVHIEGIKSNPKQWPELYQRFLKTKHFFSPIVIISLVVSAS